MKDELSIFFSAGTPTEFMLGGPTYSIQTRYYILFPMRTAGHIPFATVPADTGAVVKRTDTPSTACGDEEADFRSESWDVDRYLRTNGIEPVVRRRSRGLDQAQFKSAVRESFRFPTMPCTSPTPSVPVCVVCRSQFYGGELCRELTSCGHCFHSECIEWHFKSHSRCPVCKGRCRASAKPRPQRESSSRPCWTPDYDSELLNISDRMDRERRQKIYLLNGRRDTVPHSGVFLRSTLPTLLEEPNKEGLEADDGTLSSLSQFLYREKERRKLSDLRAWSKTMKQLGVTFMFSLCCLYLDQKIFVDLYLLRAQYFSH